MIDEISREQYDELCFSHMWDSQEEFNKMLEEVTGITAKRYIAYQYYDSSGNYVGDSNDSAVRDLLNNAYVKIGSVYEC